MPDAAAQNAITELKVSAHLMTLATGVFCVFHTPGTAAPDQASGLPGVRISRAPAPGGHQGTVTIGGFGDDGWLGNAEDAALIRVSGSPAQVLVTVYQAMDTEHAAPKLQVIRLTEDAAEAVATQAASSLPSVAPEPAAPVEVAAHVYGVGDIGGRLGEWMGERGSKRWIEGFGLAPNADVTAADVEYQAVLGRGWLSPWSEGGQFCGSRGMSLPILGLRVRLRGAAASAFTATVQATFIDGSEVGPIKDGEACEAPSLAALEAFRVVFEPRAPADAVSVERTQPASKPTRKPPARRSAPQAVAAAAKPVSRPAAKPSESVVPPASAPKPAAKRTPATTRRR